MTIKILGRSVKVKLVSRDKLEEKSGGPSVGCYLADERTIYIDESLKEPIFTQTMYHEMVHALFDLSGLFQVINSDIQELLCENVANLIVDIGNIRTRQKQ